MTLSLLSSMEEAAKARRQFQSVQDGRIQTVLGDAVDPVVSGAYVRNKVRFMQEDSIRVTLDGQIQADDEQFDPDIQYTAHYIRGPAGDLIQIDFRKEVGSP